MNKKMIMAIALLVSVALLSSAYVIAPYQLDTVQAWSWHHYRYYDQSAASTASPSPTPSPTATPTPSPTPSPTPTSTATTANYGPNLCAINNGWWYTDDTWTNCPAENINYDTSTEYNGSPSWLSEPSTTNYGCDCQPGNTGPIALTPGQTVIMICAIMTGGSPVAGAGARIGLDFYGAKGRIGQANDPRDVAAEQPTNTNSLDIPFGSNWTLVTWNFTVPAEYMSDGGGPYPAGTMVAVTGCIPWCGSWNAQGNPNNIADVWFSDFQFYIIN